MKPSEPLVTSFFRDVPWRWRDLLIGLVPLVVFMAMASAIGGRAVPRWLWVSIGLLDMAWMLGYPLYIARRGLPRPPRPRRVLIEALLALPIVLGVLVIISLLTVALTRLFGETANRPFESIAGSSQWFDKVFLVVMGVLIAPIAEETFFRGMLYNGLRRRMHPIFAAMIQGMAFGLFHPFGPVERTSIAVGGFCLALYYEWRKTLLAPILFHGIMNALSLSILFLSMAAYANSPVLGVRGDQHEGGCLVIEVVPASAAADAGLLAGDLITAVAENSTRDVRDIILILRTKKVGDKIPVYYRRGGQDRIVEVTLKARPD